ncbi:MAG TPA: FAD binding domain-containing protein [Lachnospiraceae bacterium]|nr:FAD binding domain-containing protein [Lachnospiraceae bacterium]
MIKIKEYRMAESLEEAWQINQKRTNRIIGGMLWVKMGSGNVQTAIDLSGLSLDTIEETEEEFRIGCMVSLRQLEQHKGLNEYSSGAVREAVRHIVGVQFRNLATIGGSIYGRFGFSDVLTIFMVMDAYVELYKGGILPLREFAKTPYDRDILVRLIIKKKPASFYYQSVRNTRTDFPVLTCAAVKEADETYRFAIGARPAKALLLDDVEGILHGAIEENTIKTFVEYAKKQIPTQTNVRGSAAYRTHLAGVLVERALVKLKGETPCR